MKPLTFSVLRLLSSDEFRSGEEIAAILGVSRASVSNALADLGQADIQVFKVRGQGYRLSQPVEWLDPEFVVNLLVGDARTFALDVANVVESTNTALMQQAALGARHGQCLVAELQTGGRGRRGRAWESSIGGSLTFSLLWRFNQGIAQLSGLSLAVGVALVRAMRDMGVGDAALKWPNDVVHNYRKLGGILIELQGEALGPAAAVIGVGLNVQLSERARGRVDQAVVDMQGVLGTAPSRNALLAAILSRLAEVLSLFEREGFAVLVDEWVAAHAYQGRLVSMALPSGVQEQGWVRGVAEDGSLLVETAGGKKRFATGEISLRPVTGRHASAPMRERGA